MERSFVKALEERVKEPAPLIQAVLGPRQVGKTTGVEQLMARYPGPCHFVSADDSLAANHDWLQDHWQTARRLGDGAFIAIDEIQKIPDWSAAIKALWDKEKKTKRLRCVLLGSSSLALQRGLTESLTGRFELLRVYHWSYAEWAQYFRTDLDDYLRYGGYPGAQAFSGEYSRWFSYVRDAIVDTVIGKDILSQHAVAKPALFRQAFAILCSYPAQEMSYSKLLGQLQDKGNTDLIKHYIELYEGAFLFASLFKYSQRPLLTKSSSPKILPLAPCLHTVAAGADALDDPQVRGHVFEAAIGAELIKIADAHLTYWRDRGDEVDFILRRGRRLYAIEVKSGRKRSRSGLKEFCARHPSAVPVIIGPENYLEISKDPSAYFDGL